QYPVCREGQPAGKRYGDVVGVGSQLEGVIDASVGSSIGAAERRRFRTVGDQRAGIVRIEPELGNLVGVGLHIGSVEELGYVLRSVEIDLQIRALAGVS